MALGGSAEQANGVGKGARGVLEAAEPAIDRRQNFPAAAVLGIVGEVLLDARDEKLKVLGFILLGHALGHRLSGQVRGAEDQVEHGGGDGNGGADGDKRQFRVAARGGFAALQPGLFGQKPAGNLDPGGAGFLGGDHAALHIRVQFAQLRLVDFQIGGRGWSTRALIRLFTRGARQRRGDDHDRDDTQNRKDNPEKQSGPFHHWGGDRHWGGDKANRGRRPDPRRTGPAGWRT